MVLCIMLRIFGNCTAVLVINVVLTSTLNPTGNIEQKSASVMLKLPTSTNMKIGTLKSEAVPKATISHHLTLSG